MYREVLGNRQLAVDNGYHEIEPSRRVRLTRAGAACARAFC